uniref:Bromodomain containing protein n=1 Tax=Wuchereria bancrofti TaxID=6293 RepID=A0AAF5RW45_WUCBA
MPSLGRKQFRPSPCPVGLKPDDKVFYLPLTNEIFTSYDDFFQRQISLSSMVWTCSVTGKTGLTFEEALDSEKNAQETLKTYPPSFARPILYLVYKLSCRGRIEDLVNDIYFFVKDHFLLGEEVTYSGGRGRKDVIIKKVTYIDVENDVITNQHNDVKKPAIFMKRGELLIPPAERYMYDVLILDKHNGDAGNKVLERVSHQDLLRSKSLWARNMIRVFLKNSCITDHERLTVKKELLENFQLDSMSWNEVFAGPIAQFPRTPLMHRGPSKGISRPSRNHLNGHSADDLDAQSTSDADFIDIVEKDKLHSRSKKASLEKDKKENDKKGESGKKTKKKRAIAEQQEELESLFEQARKVNIENLSHWEQDERLLSEAEIVELKQLIRQTKEKDREEKRLNKQRAKEMLLEWKKPRDDILCDDLQPLPQLAPLLLPLWMSDDDFGDYLYIFEFFQSFAELLPIKEVRGINQVKFGEIISAVRSRTPEQDSLFVQLMHILLKAKAERADEEDGDEANLSNKEEIPVDANDIDHKIYGPEIRQATILHEDIRLTHGLSARHLPIDWMTLTEVMRLSLMTSGYYTGAPTHRFRLFSRGAIRCYEDEGFLFAKDNPQTMSILEKKSVFDLQPYERIALFKVVIQQLLSYHKFRSTSDERIISLLDVRKELKNLRNFDAAQEKEAREASLVREYEAEQLEELGEAARADFVKKEEPSKETITLINFVKGGNFVGRRDERLREVEQILMKGVSYAQMEADEIKKVRSLQVEHTTAAENDLLKLIYKIQSRVGWHCLGRDRGFRTYWFFSSLPLLLVENTNSMDERGPCLGPTPLDRVDEKYRQLCESDDKLRQDLLSCTATEDCPVHGKFRRSRWQLIKNMDVLNEIESACNSRGFRESELLENLKFFSPLLKSILGRCSDKISSGEIYADLLLTDVDLADNSVAFDWSREFIDMLLDLEEKVEQGCIGHLAINDIRRREEWRESLLQKRNVTSFIESDVEVFGETVFTVDEVKSLSELEHLAVAFLQIVQGINLKFLRLPFATASSKEKDCANIPTTTFDQWQKSLLKCCSISALSLYYTTLESSILWTRSRLQARCRKCRKKGETEKLCMCARCDRCYHIDCAKPKIKDTNGWMCSDCKALVKAQEAEEKWKSEQAVKKEEEEEQSYSRGSDDACGTSADEFSEQPLAEEEFELPSDMLKTSSGRIVKKVAYADESFEEMRKTVRKKNLVGGESDEGESTSESECSYTKRKRPSRSGERALGNLTISLRETDNRIRNTLRAFELLISDAMRQQIAWPFLKPVDAKAVPDYYQIIKRPMDLRTIMNKLKQRLYDTPDQVIADARLIFENCRIYNEEESEIYKCANKLEQFMEERFSKILQSNAIRTRSEC